MNTTHIKSFIQVSKYNSISKAASQLNYSNSTVQGHLKALENEMNVKLYERTNSGIYLTEKGIVFLDYAKKILDIENEIQNKFENHDKLIRVTASESVNFFVMKSLINKFIKMYPSVDIEYTKAITDTAIEKLTENECDISIIAEPKFTSSSQIKCDFLCKLPLSFVASPKHRCFRDGLVNSREDNILLCTMRLPVLLMILAEQGLSFADYFPFEKNIGDLQTLKELVLEGHGIALLPTTFIEDDLAENRMKVIPELNYNFHHNVYILTSLANTSKRDSINQFVLLAHELLSDK